MAQSLLNKVVVVTGAGRGVGREIAILCAREGAAVVVNDLGADPTGSGEDLGPANQTVEDILTLGGKAVVNGDSVADPKGAERMVEAAVRQFGQIDVVVNNAGILRDRIWHRMSHEDWRAVVDVHLNGCFNVAKAATPYFREQEAGSFIHFTSTSALIGNFGQANYSAAKLGIVGLSQSIALDMARFGVRSNCIAPFAWSRLAETIPAQTPEQEARLDRFRTMTADKIAPLAAFLAGDASREVTNQIFCVRKNEIILFSKPRPVRSMHKGEGWTPQSIAEELLPAFRPNMGDARIRTADIFDYDPV